MTGTASRYIVNRRKTSYSGHIEQSKPVLVRFFNNVSYLLRVRGMSQRELKKAIFDFCGFSISYCAISNFKRKDSDHVTAQLCYLGVYADFFKVELTDLLSRDFEAESKLGKAG